MLLARLPSSLTIKDGSLLFRHLLLHCPWSSCSLSKYQYEPRRIVMSPSHHSQIRFHLRARLMLSRSKCQNLYCSARDEHRVARIEEEASAHAHCHPRLRRCWPNLPTSARQKRSKAVRPAPASNKILNPGRRSTTAGATVRIHVKTSSRRFHPPRW